MYFDNDLVDLFLLLHLDPDLEPCTTEYTSTLWNWLCATFYLYTSVLSTKYTSVISHCLFPSDLSHSHLGVVHPVRVSIIPEPESSSAKTKLVIVKHNLSGKDNTAFSKLPSQDYQN